MKHFFLFLLLFVTLLARHAEAQCSNEGREFYVAFPTNYPDSLPRLSLYLASRIKNTTVKVEYGTNTVQTIPLTAGNVASVVVPVNPCQLTQNRTINSKAGIHVYSVDSTPFSLYGMSRVFFSTDAFTGIPVNELGMRYRLASYTKDDDPGDGNPECAVIATQDSTVVTFNIPGTAGNPTTIMLNKRQSYLLQDPKDLTGGLVTASKPIAVFSGNQCTYVPSTSQACDMLLEQLLPTSTWNKLFYVSPYAGRPNPGDILRVTGDSAGTFVYFNGGAPAFVGAGTFVERNFNTPMEITSTKPVQVMQYAKSFSSAFNGDPFMMVAPPAALYRDGFTFSVPSDSASFTPNYVSIIALAKDTASVMLDAAPISTPWKLIPASSGNKKFAVTDVQLTSLGSHEVSYEPLPPDSDRYTLSGSVYGWGNYDSYGYVASFGTVPKNITIAYTMHPDSVDLGTVVINRSVDSSALFINKSSISLRIGSIHFMPDTFPATVITSAPQTLGAGDTLVVRFKAHAPKTKTYRGQICVEIDSPCFNGELCMPVTITGNNVSVCVETSPTSTMTPGTTALLPVIITPSDPIPDTRTVDVSFSYNTDLLVLLGIKETTLGTISGFSNESVAGICSFRFTANDTLPPSQATIARVLVQALLAPHLNGTISVSPAPVTLATNEAFIAEPCSSDFIIGEKCIRPDELQLKSITTITGLYPNPTRGLITVIIASSQKENPVDLEITDIFGRVVEKSSRLLAQGKQEISFSTAICSAGLYFVKVRSTHSTEVRAFSVNR